VATSGAGLGGLLGSRGPFETGLRVRLSQVVVSRSDDVPRRFRTRREYPRASEPSRRTPQFKPAPCTGQLARLREPYSSFVFGSLTFPARVDPWTRKEWVGGPNPATEARKPHPLADRNGNRSCHRILSLPSRTSSNCPHSLKRKDGSPGPSEIRDCEASRRALLQ